MDDSTVSTSADPLTLPSSPLVRHHSPRRSNTKPLRARSPEKQQFSSPAKSFIMDTGEGGNEQSPWRIKVTVQAEPRHGSSPGKKPVTKTTTVPLKGGSSSPAKRPKRGKKAAEVEEDGEMQVEVRRPHRKRKGTPMRRAAKRPTPAKVAEDEEEEDQRMLETGNEQDVPVVSSPAKKPVRKGGRKSLGTMPTQRGQRLSQAREELDEALQDAVGSSDRVYDRNESMPPSEAMQADMTAMNEDFTMVSVETLQSMKQNTSMLEDSQIDNRSAANGSYWPSSPPQTQNPNRKSSRVQSSPAKVDYPNISAQAQYARDTPAKYFVQAFDAMSWKPTGQALQEPTPAESSELLHSSGKKHAATAELGEWQVERERVSQQIEDAPKEDVVIVEDEPEAELGAQASDDEEEDDDEEQGVDEDIWAEEASRSLEEDVETSYLSHPSRQPSRHAKSATAEHLNDLFSGMSSKPPRAKIPRTWRKSSGEDFQYSDSPPHSFAQQQEQEQEQDARKPSSGSGMDEEGDEAERGSGVLTPPSTDEDEDEDVEEDKEMDEDDDDRDEVGASKSTFEPDAAATELQVRNAQASDSASNENSNDSAPSPDGEDTGLFWRSNLPTAYKQSARPRLAEQKKARDLSDLFKEIETSRVEKEPSPVMVKSTIPAPQQASTQLAQPAKRFPGSRILIARREAASSSFTSTSSNEQPLVSKGPEKQKEREKMVNSMLGKSLLQSSDVGKAVTDWDVAAEVARKHAQSGQRGLGVGAAEAKLGESVVDASLSFASKASDQRQLLEETRATPAARPKRKIATHVEVDAKAEESLWLAAGREDELNEGEEEDEEDVSSPAQSVGYSADSEVQYTDEYDSDEEDGEREGEEEEEHEGEGEDEYESDNIIVSQGHGNTTLQSYEEHLNISSPQKIRVNFGESSTAGHSSLLQPKKAYPSLFEQRPPSRGHQHQAQAQPQERTLISKSHSTEPGILSKLTSTFWSAVIRPSGPIVEPVFPVSLRIKLRSRYGVLSAQHPWTMSHMRTLHRMINSCAPGKGKADSVVPKPGELTLPSSLTRLAGKKLKDPSGRPFLLTEQLCHVIWALTQTLVPHALIAQMDAGEIDFIGDSLALACRGYFDEYQGKPRHGSDRVFGGEGDGVMVWREPREGESIGVEWVARCVGACGFAQEEFEARGERIAGERRAWEERNGVVGGDESEVLQKVRGI